MGLLVLLTAVALSSEAPSGIELIQQCRVERTKALAATNDRDFAERRYLECLNRGQA